MNKSLFVPCQYDLGGKLESNYPGETDDCFVRALSICTGMGYNAAHWQMATLGRKFQQPVYHTPSSWQIKDFPQFVKGFKVQYNVLDDYVKHYFGGDTERAACLILCSWKLSDYLAVHPIKRGMIGLMGHMVAVKDNVVYDNCESLEDSYITCVLTFEGA